MRILVITSCTGEKKYSSSGQLTQKDFINLNTPEFIAKETELLEYQLPAEELYTGQQHLRLMRGVKVLREKMGSDSLDLHILSAGYGIIPGAQKIVPYECTFQGMKAKELRSWADMLDVPKNIREVLAQPYDLGLILLGDAYLKACNLDESVNLGGPTILFCGSGMGSKLPELEGLRKVVLTNKEAKRFSCGLVALKGDLTSRLLQRISTQPSETENFLNPGKDLLEILDREENKPKKSKGTKVNPAVDVVINIPKSWWEKPHRRSLRYFIPEWDDLVDPDYDFENDIHSGGRGNWNNEVYAHQMYPEPNYDGLLVSKVVAEKSKSKKELINKLGVHRFTRVPQDFPIMGDSGAFGYIMDEVPPYTTEEMLEYYTRLQFNYGVSLDHLIVTATEEQKQFRYELTLNNAEDFLREHQKQGLPWEPIAGVQGWDPQSYAEAARQCVAMGYGFIALGGLVRTTTPEILKILEEVHKVVPSHVQMHLFGLARFKALKACADLGVTSVDSASFLRRAWLGTGQNYLDLSGEQYAAIRIPQAEKSFRAKRMVSEGRCSAEKVAALDASCMKAMVDFDAGHLSVEATLDALEEYDDLITPDRKSTRHLLKKTLEAAPWKKCPCEICQKDGIQVIIFRGNNRNRRRGFHNTYVFYRLAQRALAGELIHIGAKPEKDEDQLGLFGVK